MQFIWGKLLGRHKILAKVSPNKTWEGFLGGVISTTVIGYFLGFLTPLSAPNVILVSALVAIAGFSGDVVISAIKRDKGIKDMEEQYSRSWRSIRPDRFSGLHGSCIFSFSLLHCILNGGNEKKIHASCCHADYI